MRDVLEIIKKRFEENDIDFSINRNLIPPDNTTLFTTAGMQFFKDKFINSDNSVCGSLQSCLRTNDLDLVGDGVHLSYFEMIGNFSFGRNDYQNSIELWHSIITDLVGHHWVLVCYYHEIEKYQEIMRTVAKAFIGID